MRKIVYMRPDGGLSVVIPVINTIGEVDGFIESDAEKRAWDKLPTDAINSRFVEESEIPTDRTFRNAWEDIGSVVVNMPKAREIYKELLRQKRTPLLTALDIDYMRADEIGDVAEKRRIAAEKQVLRDITAHPGIEAAQTPDELISVGVMLMEVQP